MMPSENGIGALQKNMEIVRNIYENDVAHLPGHMKTDEVIV